MHDVQEENCQGKKKSPGAEEEIPDKPAEMKIIPLEDRRLGRQYPDVLQQDNASRGLPS
ncbi:hypothetical protein PC114_g20428 [Phytophthora cactorum]|nr:hypothetical protein PC114_g20428 [Phytophthora cactorum]KAG3029470.1 hypothetical protein PC120_g4270 [Phytophthora cactorum]KAG3085819.1 hypothetical protein PC121_g5098 [Phytophthora cactorum]